MHKLFSVEKNYFSHFLSFLILETKFKNVNGKSQVQNHIQIDENKIVHFEN